MKKIKSPKTVMIITAIVYALAILFVLVDFFITEETNYLAIIILAVSIISFVILYFTLTNYHNLLANDIEEKLDTLADDALKEGIIGAITYDEDYVITWLSSIFIEKDINRKGEKLLVWLPELQDLLSGKADKATVVINDDKYEVTKKEESYALLFKDISKAYDLERELNNKAYVIGLLNFDNFDESTLKEDELAFFNSNIRTPVTEYLKNYNVVYNALKNNRIQLLLNNEIYQKLLDDRFSILARVRREAKGKDLDTTLSLAFALGSDDLTELDSLASDLLELAINRGGDQVVTRKVGHEAIFYGGSSEAKERASKVKVRVIANTIKRSIDEAKNVLIVGHEDADSDCVGSALAVSLICKALKKDAYIVMKSGSIEPMVKDALSKYEDIINSRHNFISENEALDILSDDTLVIMVDHHSIVNSNCKELLQEANKIIIIDHHRRKADLDVNATFMYVEAGASSATEMVVEMFSYFSRNFDVTKEEANIMYIGLLIDTNHFKARTNSRTFDVAKTIKQYGADTNACEELIEEPYEMTRKRYEILSEAKRYKDNIMIANVSNIYPRSIASQAVNIMVDIKEIDCAFVIWKLSNNEVAISARSNGKINVQVIIEKLGGGGHLAAAGLQTKEYNQDELYDKLIEALNEYLESVEKDESNIVE